MTIGTAGNRVSLNCDGATKIFPVNLQAYLAGDFTVILTAPAAAGGGQATLVLNSDYSLVASSTDAPPKWTLTTLAANAYLAGYSLQAFVNAAQVQQTSYVQGQAFPSLAMQTNLDRLTQMVQRVEDQVSRAVRAPDGDVSPLLLLPPAGQRALMNLTTDVNGNIALSLALAAGTLSAASIGAFLYPQTAAEIANVVTPTFYYYPPGDIRRYGADPTGVLDSTTAINNALLCNSIVYAIAGTYKCSASLNMANGQTFYGDGSATVLQFANGALSNIVMQSLTSSGVRNLKINVTGTGGTTKLGGVYLSQCTACRVEQVEVVGFNWSGVWLDQSNQCTISKNYFHGAPAMLNTTGNGGDINLWSNSATLASNYNVIDGNQCFGTNTAFGIMLIDPDAATAITGYPSRNVVSNNRIGAHTTYGIAIYMPGAATTAADTCNQIVNNWVENITGLSSTGFSGSPNTSSGAGIYAVGKGIGGTIITGNGISNCCTQTLIRNLAPAGIGVNGVQTGISRPVVANNVVTSMTQGDGILVTSSPGGAIVLGNSITMPSSNTGAGAGGGALLGAGLRIEACSDVEVGPNHVQSFGNGQGLYLYANGIQSSRFSVTGGSYTTNGTGAALQIAQNGGFNLTQLAITGAKFVANGGAVDSISINAVIVGNLTNVMSTVTTARALFLNGCTNMRLMGGEYTTTGAVAIGTSGACTNSVISKDVNWGNSTGATASLMVNAGTGCNVEANFSSVPTAGTWVLGDRAVHLGVTVGNAKAWARVTSGSGNVLATDWISEGNL